MGSAGQPHGRHTHRSHLRPGAVLGASCLHNLDVRATGPGSSWWIFALPVFLLVTLLGWAFTSPVGSSPDDDYHLASIWCAGGERAGVCESDPDDSQVRLVPASVGFAHECFAYDASITAACADSLTADLMPTDRVNNVQGLYPGTFYSVMGLFIGPDKDRSIAVMRVVNALIAVGFLALALRLLAPAIRSAVVVVVAVVYVPLGLFIIPSTNPSSWSLTGVTFLWAFGLALAQRTNWRTRRTWILASATFVTAALAVGSRVDAAAYVAGVVVVVLILTGYQRMRRAWISGAILIAIALIGLIRFVSFATPGSGVSGGMGGTEPGVGLLVTNIVYLPVYLSGAVGSMALGWNDTALPPLVFVFGVLVLGALAYRGVLVLPRRKLIATLVALAALALVPLVFLQREGLGVGEVVQARYLLPLIVVLFATVSLALPYGRPSRAGLPLARPAAWLIAVAMSASAGLSLWVHAHRYAAGSTRGLFDIDLTMEWTGLLSVPLMMVVSVGVLATIGYQIVAMIGVYRDGDPYFTGRRGSPTTASHPE